MMDLIPSIESAYNLIDLYSGRVHTIGPVVLFLTGIGPALRILNTTKY
jgi:hypothetical protein